MHDPTPTSDGSAAVPSGAVASSRSRREILGQGTCNPCPSATGGTNCPPMVDTLSLVCPVDEGLIAVLAAVSGRRLLLSADGAIERDTPRIGSLPGSYDPNLWVQPWSIDGKPALRLEGSAHRHILGHNVYGGPLCPIKAGRYMIGVLGRYLGVPVPDWTSWSFQRIDLAWVFDAGSEDAALAFMVETGRSLHTTTAARSLPRSFGTCHYLNRSKLYMKGPELRKHMPEHLTKSQRHELMREAASLLRFEVTFHRRDIARLTFTNLESLDLEPLIRQAHEKLNTFNRTTDDAMQTVRTTASVQARLHDLYSPGKASALMGTWFKLTTLGEAATRSNMSNRSYYRHLAELKTAGVAWTGTDIVRIHSLAFPEDFSLSLSSRYLVRSGEHPQVSEVLAAVA